MTCDTVQLHHNDAQIFRPFRHLDPSQFLHRPAVAEIIVHRRHIIEPIRKGDALNVRTRLQELFNAAMKIPHDRPHPDDVLSVELQFDTQNAMGRRMLGPHIQRIRFSTRHSCALLLSGFAAHAAAQPLYSLCAGGVR